MSRARLACVALFFFAGCGPVSAVSVGESLFNDPRLSSSAFNAVSCATCHDVDEDEAGLFSGGSLRNVVFRPTWWGGAAPTLLDAVNNCLVFFMRAPALSSSDPRGRALYEYLLEKSPTRPDEAEPFHLVENVTSVARGNPNDGADVWARACQSCHGEPHSGAGRLSDLVTIVPEGSVDFAQRSGFPLDLVIIEKVRHGPFFGVGGNMPPFSVERLSDEQLGALLAFLQPDDG